MKTSEGKIFDAAMHAARLRLDLQAALSKILPILPVSAAAAEIIKSEMKQAVGVGANLHTIFAADVRSRNVIPFPRRLA